MFKVPDNPEVNGDLNKSVMEIFRAADIDIDEREVESIFRVGKEAGKRPVKIVMVDKRAKYSVLKQNMKLKDTGVILEKDLSEAEREKKDKLRSLKKDLERHGKIVKLKGFKLLVDRQFLTYQDAEKKLNSFEKRSQQRNIDNVPSTPKNTKTRSSERLAALSGTKVASNKDS